MKVPSGRSWMVLLVTLRVAACGGEPEPEWRGPADPLHRAAWTGRAAEVVRLLDRGADPNARGEHEWTPLHFAALAGRAEVARVLVDRGADAGGRGQLDLTPLHLAAMAGRPETVPVLASRGGRASSRNLYGATPLHLAANPAVAEALLAAGASLEAVDDDGMTPLHLARTFAVAQTLLAAGGDVQRRARDGRSVMQMAINELDGVSAIAARPPARLRGDEGFATLTLQAVGETTLEGLTFSGTSVACFVDVAPAAVARLAPGQRARIDLRLRRMPGVGEGLFPLDLDVRAGKGGRLLGRIDLAVDTRPGITPEDRGLIRLGRAQVRPAPGRWHYVIYLAAPVAAVALWLLARRLRAR